MSTDNMAAFKATQKDSWNLFAPLEVVTIIPAGRLVHFADLQAGQSVLDVACGTGVVAITAARRGCRVSGIDLAPRLVAKAKDNAAVAGFDIPFLEGDVEALPYPDHSFDVVLSQYGHMFAPRAALALKEMLRVLKPGGRLAFSTWPPEHYVGKLFTLTGQYSAPSGIAIDPPALWGDPQVVSERLGTQVADLTFERDIMHFPVLSVGHYRAGLETTLGPVIKLVADAKQHPERLAKFRSELNALMAPYLCNNTIRQHYLMTRATKL